MIPMNYPRDFNGLYTYSLVKYGSTKPPELLEYKNDQVINTFRRAFDADDLTILLEEINNVLDWFDESEILRRIDVHVEWV